MITTNSQGQPISQAFIDAVALPSISYKLELWSNGSKLDYEIQRATLELGTGYGVSGDTDFALGQASSSQLTAYLFDATIATGTQIEVRVGVEVSPDTYEFVSVANVTVESSVVAGQITTVKASGAIAHMTQTCSLSGWQTPAAIASELGITLGAFANTPEVYLEANLSRREALQALVRALGGQACEVGAQGVTASPYSSSATYTVPEDFIMKDPQLPEAYTVDGLTVTATEATYTYGTGRVKVNIPTCTQAGADALWANVQGYTFTPGIVEVALIDPRVTPLDVLEVNFKGSTWNVPVQGISITYDGGYFGRYQSVGLSATQEAVLIQGPVEKAATQASGMAQQALDVAEATGQHFWDDGSGAHVTEATREEWEQQQSGPNSLWNSLGMLFRDGLNNLLAIVTGQNPGLQIYDGQGNTDENIIASFNPRGATIASGIDYDESAEGAVEFFDGRAALTDAYYASNVTSSSGEISQIAKLAGRLEGDGAPLSGSSEGQVKVNNTVSGVANSASISMLANTNDSRLAYTALTVRNKNGGEVSEISMRSKTMFLVDANDLANTATVPMSHVIDMLTTSSTALTRSSATSSWTSGEVKRSGKVVTVTVVGAKLAAALASGSNSAAITTIPYGFRPTMLQRVPCALSANGNYANVWAAIGTGGAIVIGNHSAISIPNTSEISLNCTYIIN